MNAANAMKLTLDGLRQLPKVELHRHLECSLRLSTLKELAREAGVEIPPSEAAIRREWLVTEPMTDLEAVLRKFLATQSVLSSEEILTRITYEAIEDAYRENIRILELRYAPTYIQLGHEYLSFEQIQRAIVKGVKLAEKLPIAVGLIMLIQRTRPTHEAERVVDFAIDHKDEILALDLADNEVGFDPAPFAKHFQRGKKAGLHITIHSGEADVPGSAERVRDAIELLGAERIGHGVQIYKSPEMIAFVKSQRVPLELCPTSNWLTNAVPSIAAHPLKSLREQGVLVTLNSDDPGIFAIDLTNEYSIAHNELGMSQAELESIADVAAAASFIPLKFKQQHWPRTIT